MRTISLLHSNKISNRSLLNRYNLLNSPLKLLLMGPKRTRKMLKSKRLACKHLKASILLTKFVAQHKMISHSFNLLQFPISNQVPYKIWVKFLPPDPKVLTLLQLLSVESRILSLSNPQSNRLFHLSVPSSPCFLPSNQSQHPSQLSLRTS
jgi:hypothetical protein